LKSIFSMQALSLSLGSSQQPGHAPVLFKGPLPVHQHGEAVFKAQFIQVRLPQLLGKGVGHGGQFHVVQLVQRLLRQHERSSFSVITRSSDIGMNGSRARISWCVSGCRSSPFFRIDSTFLNV
jgi:hypothetical protein